MIYEQELNEKQYQAVSSCAPYLRIIAGAGSGKTRVLTYRIAYLIDVFQVAPWKILAITFTNKVANEMKNRVVKMIPECSRDLSIRTFHSFGANFLRQEIEVLGFPKSFTILDEEDQLKLIKDIAASIGYKKGDKICGRTLNYIGMCKLEEKYPDDVKIIKPKFEDEAECLELYKRYEEEKDRMYCLDFDDLLLRTNQILRDFPAIRMKWQNRIDHILIDEFQDTNDVQYKMVKYLLKEGSCLYVVGDPDQTIYTWRGANHKIILDLDKEFPLIETIILDRNYRSTQNILDSANKLIAYNKLRIHKDLYTKQDKGEKIVTHGCPSTYAEADFVAREIKKLKDKYNYKYNDIALLYRSNYITKDFETCFIQQGIPYKIYGGLKFYERKEIKDVLAYLHLIANPKEDISFKRIVNVPKRGIGDVTFNNLLDAAIREDKSLYEFVRDVKDDESPISQKLLNSLKAMVLTIEIARKDIEKNDEVFSKILENMIISLGYYDYLKNEEDEGEERIENVKALFEDMRHYMKTYPDSTFYDYLQNISLASSQDEMLDGDFVSLMTVHTAKGLEFPVVFVLRLNDGVFPHIRSLTESGYLGLEEERRLAYVAFTRAKERLYLTFADGYSYVIGSSLSPSQFLKESGNTVVKENVFLSNTPISRDIRSTKGPQYETKPIRQDFKPATNGGIDWKVGDIVIHTRLGKGVVVAVEEDEIIKVDFEEHGIKTIMGNHPAVSKGGFDA